MATSDNFFNIRGKVGELIFCIRNGKTYIKQYSGGFTKKHTQNHPRVKAPQQRLATISSLVKKLQARNARYIALL
jgi:PHP family Zn ribbon phosphoesterase